MKPLDPRVTAARGDIAALHLRGKVEAARFVAGERRIVRAPLAPLRRGPWADAPLETEALHGEAVTVYERDAGGWAWAQLEADGYVGWLPDAALAPAGMPPTHRVCNVRTLIFPSASIKAPPSGWLPFGASVTVLDEQGSLSRIAEGGFVPTRHLRPLTVTADDWIAVAEDFRGVPYLWGGKSGLGIDCSGLVQVALAACGMACPRDSDMQEETFGRAVNDGAGADLGLARGDLIFWPGHVAIARDATTIIHANAFHMAVAIEPAKEAIARITASGSLVRALGSPVR